MNSSNRSPEDALRRDTKSVSITTVNEKGLTLYRRNNISSTNSLVEGFGVGRLFGSSSVCVTENLVGKIGQTHAEKSPIGFVHERKFIYIGEINPFKLQVLLLSLAISCLGVVVTPKADSIKQAASSAQSALYLEKHHHPPFSPRSQPRPATLL